MEFETFEFWGFICFFGRGGGDVEEGGSFLIAL